MKEATLEQPSFLDEIKRLESERVSSGPPWLQRLRREAITRFREAGFPGPRDEAWRETNVAPIARTPFRPAPAADPAAAAEMARFPLADLGVPRLVFVNGRFASSLSSPAPVSPRVEAIPMADALASGPERLQAHLSRPAPWGPQPFALLNTALFQDGGLVTAAPGADAETAVHLLHLSCPADAPSASFPRTLVVAEPGSRLVVVESYLGAPGPPSLTDSVTELVVGENASVTHVRVQDEPAEGYHVAAIRAELGRRSRLVCVNVSLGAALARNDVGARLSGEGAECTLDGLHVSAGRQHVDNHTTIDHAVANCLSHEMYKGVLSGGARAVFNGRIIVRQGAQKTDAKQSNRNLLLSANALVHTRPQLEIYADDVRCTHGATIGHLDSDALFYLRSRGIGRQEARNVLIHAFTGSVLSRIPLDAMRAALEGILFARLDAAAAEDLP